MIGMKRIIVFVLLSLSLTLSSCVQQMQEHVSIHLGGIWASVDDYDMASTFFVFDKGYLYEYKAYHPYYVYDNTIWGYDDGEPTPIPGKYKYSVVDGVLYYNDFFKDIQVELVRDGNTMTFGEHKCVLAENITERYFSEIVLAETNETHFTGAEGCVVEWEYHIENPRYDYKLEVKEVPEWCTDVKVRDGVISFGVNPGSVTRVGNLILTYPTAGDAVVEMKRGLVEILLDDKEVCFRCNKKSAVVNYTLLNGRAGVSAKATASGSWIRPTAHNDRVVIAVDQNTGNESRSGAVVLSYDEVTVTVNVTQACEREWSSGFWVGDWLMKGKNGEKIGFRLTDADSRDYLCMTRYAGLSDEYRIAVHKVDEDNKSLRWVVSNQIIGKVDLRNGKVGNLWVYGGNSKEFSVPEEGVDICFWDDKQSVYKGAPGVEFMALATECDGEWQCWDYVVYPTFPATLYWDGD